MLRPPILQRKEGGSMFMQALESTRREITDLPEGKCYIFSGKIEGWTGQEARHLRKYLCVVWLEENVVEANCSQSGMSQFRKIHYSSCLSLVDRCD